MKNEVAVNIAEVRVRIAEAAQRAGRKPEEITLIAVTKTVEPARIAEAYQAGVRDFGENYVQESLTKIGHPPLVFPDIRWHFIGHLQSNKAKEVVGHFVLIQSVDSLSLAKELARRASQAGIVMDTLLEVKLDPNATKFGLTPDTALEVADQISQLSGAHVSGLMGMAPYSPNQEEARPFFRQLHTLFSQLPPESQQILSMGMSGDFEVAIAEGATHIRIGTALFGSRLIT